MAPKNLYKLLGVSDSADAEAIKRAFREKAKKYHPDGNGPAVRNPARFLEFREAYETLSDVKKRAAYDRELAASAKPARRRSLRGRHGADGKSQSSKLGEAAEAFHRFKSVRSRNAASSRSSAPTEGEGNRTARDRHPTPAPGGAQDLAQPHGEIQVTIEEAFRGVLKRASIKIRKEDSRGRVRTVQRALRFDIPAGAIDGEIITVSGGVKGPRDTQNLRIRIRIQPHPRFTLDGADVICDLPVAPWEAALSELIRVPTLDGIARIRLPEGTSSGQLLRLKGEGMPYRNHRGRGDFVLRIAIVLPPELTPQERDLFKDLSVTSGFNPRADPRPGRKR